MTAKEYLSQLRLLRVGIQALEERRRHYMDLATKCTPGYAAPSGAAIPGDGKVARNGGEMADRAAELSAHIERYIALEKEIEETIDAVQDPTYRTVLRLRYVSCWPLLRIANEMHYEYDYVRRLHGRALLAVHIPQKYAAEDEEDTKSHKKSG